MNAKLGAVISTFRRWFKLSQEPWVVRLVMLAFYLYVIWTGWVALTESPDTFYKAAGAIIVFSLAGFLAVGGILGAFAILPGRWYIERIGLISIGFGLLCRAVIIQAVAGSAIAASLLTCTIILLVYRWVSIRGSDLAPIAEG